MAQQVRAFAVPACDSGLGPRSHLGGKRELTDSQKLFSELYMYVMACVCPDLHTHTKHITTILLLLLKIM